MAVGRDDGARPPDLDLALRHAVVVHAEVGVGLAPIRAYAVVETGVVRHREDFLDADVPLGILGRALAKPEVGELLDSLERLRLVEGALQLDLALLVVSALRQLDRHQPPPSLALRRLDHEMRHALLERVDDDVRQLAEYAVSAADAIADLEAHRSASRPHQGADDPEQRQEEAEDEHHPVTFADRKNPERDEQNHVQNGQPAADAVPHEPSDLEMRVAGS